MHLYQKCIYGVLTHLTDATQNSKFADKFFDGVPIDFSKALMVFSFNNEEKLHPVRAALLRAPSGVLRVSHPLAQNIFS